MPKITHNNLMKLGQLLGYSTMSQGLCKGFSSMLMQAILVKEEVQFWNRLKLIEKYKADFSLLIEKINEVKLKSQDKQQKLDEQDMEFLEIPAFYDGIELYLQPNLHSDVFNIHHVSQHNLNEIYPLIHPIKLEQNNFTILFNKDYAFNEITLMAYINDLKSVFDNYNDLPVFIDSSNHNVLLKYNMQNPEKPWMYIDTNDFYKFPDNPNYFRELSSVELVLNLFNSLSRNSEYIVFNTLLALPNSQLINKDKLERKLKRLDEKYPINPEQVTMYDNDGSGILLIACANGNTRITKLLLAHEQIEVNKVDARGLTPLYVACYNEQIETAKLLLAHEKMEINNTNVDGCTSLYIACQRGHIKIIKLLLAHEKIEVNKADTSGFTPLYMACEKGHVEIIQLLLAQEQIKVNKANIQEVTPFNAACALGHVAIIKLLLNHKDIEVNKANIQGITPLYAACALGHIEIVQLLVAHEKIEINKAINNGCTPLNVACRLGQTQIVTLLLQSNKININNIGLRHNTPLLVACLSPKTQGKNELFRCLLSNKADVFHKNDKGQTALDIAFLQNNNAAIEELFFHIRKENLPLASLMSSHTKDQAILWALDAEKKNSGNGFFNSKKDLTDLKQFVRQELLTGQGALLQ